MAYGLVLYDSRCETGSFEEKGDCADKTAECLRYESHVGAEEELPSAPELRFRAAAHSSALSVILTSFFHFLSF